MNGDEAARAQAEYAPLAASACCEGLPLHCVGGCDEFTTDIFTSKSAELPGNVSRNHSCCDQYGETVLEEAARITSSDRQAAYGPPEENHKRTADLWSAYLGIQITARDVCWMNVLQKASRDAHKNGRDNLVDSCGYLRNAEICGE